MRATALFFTMVLATLLLPAVLAAPTLSSPRVTPTSGEEGATFTFTVHYTGDGVPSSIKVHLDDQAYIMLEIDPSDLNYTDGKDYEYRVTLEAGTTVFFFKVTEGGQTYQTTAQTVHVKESEGFEFTHLDVVLAVVIFMVPVVIALLFFRRISRDMHELLEEFRKNR